MLQAAKGFAVAAAAFLVAFALHVLGGATDQAWLFGIAVGLIFVTAAGFPAIVIWTSGLKYGGSDLARFAYGAGVVVGTGLTLGALWASNDRGFAGWHFPASIILVAVASAVILFVRARIEGEPLPQRRSTS